MIETLSIFINNEDGESFDLDIRKNPLSDDYDYTTIPGRNGLYFVSDDPKYSSIQYKGNIKASVIKEIEALLKGQKRKRFPADYKKSNQLMGMPKGYFEVSYRKEGKINLQHLYGKIECMPDDLKEIINLLEKEKVKMSI